MSVFAPQFFLLLGVDFFLGGAIATVILEERFPKALPYFMVVGSFIGFSQLLVSPQYLNALPDTLQFYYCAGFAFIAVSCLIVLNLHLLLLGRKPLMRSSLLLGGIFSMALPIPTSLALLFFASAYVNGVVVPLPLLPVVPMLAIYIAFLGSVVIICAMVFAPFLKGRKGFKSRDQGGTQPADVEDPAAEEEMAECPICGKLSSLSLSACPHCGAQFLGSDTEEATEDEDAQPQTKIVVKRPSVVEPAAKKDQAEIDQDADDGRPTVVREMIRTCD